jgi:hypothetical protein
MHKWTILFGLVVVLVVGFVVLVLMPPQAIAPTTEDEPTNFEECALAGFPVMESYPRQCRTDAGGVFVENIGNELDKSDIIRINEPRPGSKVSPPLLVNGEARGVWFFEASFPIELQDEAGTILGQGYAQAQGEWMTEDFVPFLSIPIEFEPQPPGSSGLLILKKDNPSGLPEHDDELTIPVVF